MHDNLPVKRHHLRPSSKGDDVRKRGLGTNLFYSVSVIRLPGNFVTDRCIGAEEGGVGEGVWLVQGVATLALPPIRGT
jgi:hypothetical protein